MACNRSHRVEDRSSPVLTFGPATVRELFLVIICEDDEE